MKTVIYDFMELNGDPADFIDGSDEMLRPEDRVTEADRRHPMAGLLARCMKEIADEERAREQRGGAD
jgi:hypothetical protein